MPTVLNCTFLFLLGLAAGSLTNTVAYRWPLGIGILHPRSFCPRCGVKLRPQDAIPILGYLLQKGKCRNCEGAIHPLHPLGELTIGTLYAAVGAFVMTPIASPFERIGVTVLCLAFISAMHLTAVIDYYHHVIPDAASVGGCIVSLALAPIFPRLHHAGTAAEFSFHHPYLSHLFPGQEPWRHAIAASATGAATGILLSLAILLFGNILFKKRLETINADSSLGIGDVKLMAFVGAFLGWQSVPVVYGLGAIAGAAAGSAARIRRGIAIVPFGPFLAAAAVVYLFLGDRILRLLGLLPG